MSKKFVIELTLNKEEIEDIRERFKRQAELYKEDFTTEDAIKELFYFEDNIVFQSFKDIDLRPNVKIRK